MKSGKQNQGMYRCLFISKAASFEAAISNSALKLYLFIRTLNYEILLLSLLLALQILLKIFQASCISFTDVLSAVFITASNKKVYKIEWLPSIK